MRRSASNRVHMLPIRPCCASEIKNQTRIFRWLVPAFLLRRDFIEKKTQAAHGIRHAASHVSLSPNDLSTMAVNIFLRLMVKAFSSRAPSFSWSIISRIQFLLYQFQLFPSRTHYLIPQVYTTTLFGSSSNKRKQMYSPLAHVYGYDMHQAFANTVNGFWVLLYGVAASCSAASLSIYQG